MWSLCTPSCKRNGAAIVMPAQSMSVFSAVAKAARVRFGIAVHHPSRSLLIGQLSRLQCGSRTLRAVLYHVTSGVARRGVGTLPAANLREGSLQRSLKGRRDRKALTKDPPG